MSVVDSERKNALSNQKKRKSCYGPIRTRSKNMLLVLSAGKLAQAKALPSLLIG